MFRGEKTDGSLYNNNIGVYVLLFTKNSSGNYVMKTTLSMSVYDDSGSDAAEGKLQPYVYRYFGTDVEQVTLVKRNSSSYNLRVTVPAQ